MNALSTLRTVRIFASRNFARLMANVVSVALVGAGYWGRKLLPKFLAAPDCSVKVVCDLHARYRADVEKVFPDLSTTGSYADVLADSDIGAVILATPPATHFALAKKAIEAGKDLWIEKPMAMRFDEGQLLVRLAETKETVLFVDHTFLYDPAIRMIRDLIDKGELGDIYHIFSQRLNLGRIKRDSNVWWNSAPHDASIALYLLPARPVSVAVHGYCYLQPDLEDLNVAVLELSGGISAFIYHNWLYPENTAKITVVGSRRLVVYEGKFDRRALSVYEYEVERPKEGADLDQDLPTTIPSRIISERKIEGIEAKEPLALAIGDFLESIRQGRAPLSDGKFSLKVLAVLEAGAASLRSGGAKTAIPV